MNTREVGRIMLGGLIIYLAVAACAGLGRATAPAAGTSAAGDASAGGGPPAGSDSAVVSDLGSAVDAVIGGDTGAVWDAVVGLDVLDALVDPVADAAATEPTSGARLKAKYRLADDGAKAYDPYTWYDSARKEDCMFQLAADGKERCMPTPANMGYAGSYFADAACSKPLLLASTACTPKYMVVPGAVSGCTAQGNHVYNVGAKASSTANFIGSPGACNAVGAPSATYTFYAPGAEVPASAFVASAWKTDP